MLAIDNKTLFRQDKYSTISNYKIKNVSEGVWVFVSSKFTEFASIFKSGTGTMKA